MSRSGVHPLAPGDRVGPYRVLEEVGAGGMGVVYRAERTDDVSIEVALKVIRPGRATARVLARFETERSALARMNHPGIARIYGAGTISDGQPYFAMEYAPGPAITDHCDARRLRLPDRLRLFIQVCDAVHHAHQKGIIHRDLKPSNIRVTGAGSPAVPKVIDFGLARAVEGPTGDDEAATRPGMEIGTAGYRSPEQREDPSAVDVRSDVYSLGALLYELVSGAAPPHAASRAVQAGRLGLPSWTGPPPPSRRLAALEDGGKAAAQKRGSSVASLVDELSRDLDWVVLRALEEDPDRRYSTPLDLAGDLERYLGHRPVEARPPSAGYRLRKFARRNRGVVATGSLIVLTLVGGLVSSAHQLVVAERARRLAAARTREVTRLADLARLEDAIAAADLLFPAYPDRIRPMEGWLAEIADPLRERLPRHEAALERLRATAFPYDSVQQRLDRETHPEIEDLRSVRLGLEIYRERLRKLEEPEPETTDDLRRRIADLETRAAELERQVTRRRTWRFADVETQWQHDALQSLVERLTRFTDEDPRIGTIADVERRLARARTAKRMAADPAVRAAWRAAVEGIAESDLYGGLELEPQVDLVPLRKDPHSGLWEFWHIPSGARPQPIKDSTSVPGWEIAPDMGLVMVLLPGGSFQMGAQADDPRGPNYDPWAEPDESPVHEVTLDPLFVSKYEMTFSQWIRLTGENPLGTRDDPPPLHPVVGVTWEEADRLMDRLGLALPTEAQWEYANRAGTTTVWWTGDEPASLKGAVYFGRDWLDVDYLGPNPFGLHGITSGVWEFCRDVSGPYDWGSPDRPSAGPAPGDGERLATDNGFRGIRGGAIFFPPRLARSANRSSGQTHERTTTVGVRPVRALNRP